MNGWTAWASCLVLPILSALVGSWLGVGGPLGAFGVAVAVVLAVAGVVSMMVAFPMAGYAAYQALGQHRWWVLTPLVGGGLAFGSYLLFNTVGMSADPGLVAAFVAMGAGTGALMKAVDGSLGKHASMPDDRASGH